MIETITHSGRLLCYLITADHTVSKTEFVTPEEANFQVGFISYPAGSEIPRHVHKPLDRALIGTSEVLFIRKGTCEIDIYTTEKELVTTRTLHCGDMVVLLDCGHGFRLQEDTIIMEIKQGPYTGLDEKERF